MRFPAGRPSPVALLSHGPEIGESSVVSRGADLISKAVNRRPWFGRILRLLDRGTRHAALMAGADR